MPAMRTGAYGGQEFSLRINKFFYNELIEGVNVLSPRLGHIKQ